MANGPAIDQDLTTRSLRTLTEREVEVGVIWLADAWGIIVARVPSVNTRLDMPSQDQALISLVVQIQCAMVLRVLNNPSGKLEQHIDDYSYRLDQAVSTGALYLSDAEAALLSAGDSTSDTAFTIKPTGYSLRDGYWSDSTTWVAY